MKPVTIEFSFDNSKLEAIHIFLKEKNSSLSDELEAFMDYLYKKYVPSQVRDFIEKKENEDGQSIPAPRPSRSKPSVDRNAACGEKKLAGTDTETVEKTPREASVRT